MKASDTEVNKAALQQGFELRDASPLAIALTGLGILAVVVAAMLVVWQLYRISSGESPTSPTNTGPWSYDQGDLKLIMEEQAKLRQQYDQHLRHYGWVDEEQGIARIPVEEAMRIVAEEGLPQWGEASESTLIEEIYRNASER